MLNSSIRAILVLWHCKHSVVEPSHRYQPHRPIKDTSLVRYKSYIQCFRNVVSDIEIILIKSYRPRNVPRWILVCSLRNSLPMNYLDKAVGDEKKLEEEAPVAVLSCPASHQNSPWVKQSSYKHQYVRQCSPVVLRYTQQRPYIAGKGKNGSENKQRMANACTLDSLLT